MLRRHLTLQPSLSTSSLQTLSHREEPHSPLEFEDIVYGSRSKSRNAAPISFTDIFARESDVTISNQVPPLTEYRGFALLCLVTLTEVVFLVWGLTDRYYLNFFGIYYYPSRWWFLTLNATLLMLMLFIYVALQFWNWEIEADPIDSLNCIVDDDAVVEKNWEKFAWCETNGVFDLRLCDVNRILYDDAE